MKRIVQALLRRHERARLDRGRAAVIDARKRFRRNGANIPSRPGFRREQDRRRVGPARTSGPRYVRDGNLITLVPPFGGAPILVGGNAADQGIGFNEGRAAA
jgi:hypothetical protein